MMIIKETLTKLQRIKLTLGPGHESSTAGRSMFAAPSRTEVCATKPSVLAHLSWSRIPEASRVSSA